jgi:hypothetical protein
MYNRIYIEVEKEEFEELRKPVPLGQPPGSCENK